VPGCGAAQFALVLMAGSLFIGQIVSEEPMGMYIGSTVINTDDVDRAITFWTAALGYVVRDADPSFAVLTDPKRRWSNVSLQRTEEPKRGRNRVHLDVYSADRDAEVARLEGLGAVRLPWEYEPDHDHTVMADLDGNEFCVVQSPYRQD